MQYTVREFVEKFERIVPKNLQEDWDNSGGQIILNKEKITSIVCSMDLTDKTIEYAIEKGSNLIFTHHPLFFAELKSIDDEKYLDKNILRLIENKISVYSSHTNLDVVSGGVNDEIAKILNLENIKGLQEVSEGNYIGRIGINSKYSLKEIVGIFKEKYSSNIKIYGKVPSKVEKIGLCGGAGASLLYEDEVKDLDLYITGDIKYHDGQYAYENNMCIMDIGHFGSEVFILEKMANLFKNDFGIESYCFEDNVFEIKVD